MDTKEYDVVVVGGGINGAGIARDLAGRGYSVLLCEKDDLAQHTSSSSTKLIHGGLRYLEYYEFGLVRKALQEREVLLKSAPHIMWPLRFVMPHDSHLRPAWLIRAGMFLYDHLARREILPGSRGVSLKKHVAGGPLRPHFHTGFIYSDGWVQDARLVTLCAMDAQERGATVLTRTAVTRAERQAQGWLIDLSDDSGQTRQVHAKALVNAAGPWVGSFLETAQVEAKRKVRLVKGSHIVVKRLYDHPYAYIFQNPDKRIIFAIPFEQDFTLIGTTDVEYTGDPAKVAIDADETAYLCDMASRYFTRAVIPADVVWTYSGVRPLLDDESSNAASVTRDYELVLDQTGAPLLSVFGGKITTFRKLAEEAADRLQGLLKPGRGAWTASAALPGGDLPVDITPYIEQLETDYPWLPAGMAQRLARTYGSRSSRILEGRRDLSDLGTEVVPGLFEAELRYLVEAEFARKAEDILWRRSKLGLRLPADAASKLDAWLSTFRGA
ncbi:glycerol-3-phosphate dehydrogenase [Parachitinimonas caeni]|uniref:Glycerol-3-phosphate dehydrogenase n=1 Tax=Parachitinimonas caeni TaxID=3031301 RepID=A0ABT7E343_9NEIS|nr:glycerol-3-phosphate dehydrogenase [Parachitinimonas caeni]MDK2126736.1 glycerol-3-phosphate dehydrogenase [Parachitinimonas caeni]